MTEPTLDASKTALVVIDLQRNIVEYPTAPHPAAAVVQRSAGLLAAARRAGILPILVHVGGAPDHADRLLQSADRPTPPRPGSSDFTPEIAPQDGDVVIFKRQWGAFYGTDLDLQLRRRRIDTLILCGIATERGVESTARDAYERNYRQFLVEDAMSGLDELSHRNAIERTFPRIGHVRRTDQMLAMMAPPTQP
ncbi:MAG TPA: isochorismatase family protein [Parasulfuritortus sp.]